MDYTYFGAAPQPYAYMAISPTGFSHGLDPKTTHSIEPLETNFLPQGPYDGFPFITHALSTSQGSPDPLMPHTPMPAGSLDSGIGGDMEDSQAMTARSSSEEKEAGLTPAQSRRKAQNRAAQRAFRERKERHVRDLETKLTLLESSAHTLQSDNERLKLALQRARTENEILRATSGSSPMSSRPVSASYPSPGALLKTEDTLLDDDEYNVQSLPNGSVVNSADKEHAASLRALGNKSKEIPASQVWDLIQSHQLIKQGLVDIADVCERLKNTAKCDGHGPVFEETIVWAAIECSRRSGSDELI